MTMSPKETAAGVAAPERPAALQGHAEGAEAPMRREDVQAEVEALLQTAGDVECDIAIVGGGPAGYVAAIHAAQKRARTVLVEGRAMGGTCLNVGCIPTKCLLASVEAYKTAKDGKEFGFTAGDVTPDFPAMLARARRIVDGLVKGIAFLMSKNKVQVIEGMADFEDAKTLVVNGKRVKAKSVIIATGSKVATLNIPGVGDDYITSDTALDTPELPGSMVMLGGGVIGIEWGSIYQDLGVQVHVVEMLPDVLPGVEKECAGELVKALKKAGMKFYTGVKLVRAEKGDKAAKKYIVQDANGKETAIEADALFMAVGRRPNLTMDFERVGIKVERGAIVTDEYLRTTVPGVYAVGDASNRMLLAHKASEEGIIAVDNALGGNRKMDWGLVPACVYTHPEIASVGLTEEEAKEKGYDVKTGRFAFRPLGKAQAINQRLGFVKWVTDARYGQILGCHIVGPHADDLIAEAVIAIASEATIETVAHTIHAHPSLPEAMMEAALDVLGEMVHG
jgi:dihydrolipoamide dehydrogenase